MNPAPIIDVSKETKCLPFPLKLRAMLEDALEEGLEQVVSWEMEGAAFRVHIPELFVKLIMPKYFNQTKYKSFQRQLNLYGYSRITRGPHKGCYLHDCFHRDNAQMCQDITRKKATEEASQVVDLAPTWLPADMVVEPDPIHEESKPSVLGAVATASPADSTTSGNSMINALESYFQTQVVRQQTPPEDNLKKPDKKKSGKTAEPSDALQRMVDNILEPGEPDEKERKKYQRTAMFPDKLHDMLDHCEKSGLKNIASWEMCGCAFKVHDIDLFMKFVMPTFFKQTKYESLQRQLNLYNFTRVPKGPRKGCYYHPLFLKGGQALSRGMVRRKPEDIVVVIPPNKAKMAAAVPVLLQEPTPLLTGSTQDSSPSGNNSSAGSSYLFDQLAHAAQQVEEPSSSFAIVVEPDPLPDQPTSLANAAATPIPNFSQFEDQFMSRLIPDTKLAASANGNNFLSCKPSSNSSGIISPNELPSLQQPQQHQDLSDQALWPFGFSPAVSSYNIQSI